MTLKDDKHVLSRMNVPLCLLCEFIRQRFICLEMACWRKKWAMGLINKQRWDMPWEKMPVPGLLPFFKGSETNSHLHITFLWNELRKAPFQVCGYARFSKSHLRNVRHEDEAAPSTRFSVSRVAWFMRLGRMTPADIGLTSVIGGYVGYNRNALFVTRMTTWDHDSIQDVLTYF